MVKNIQNVIRYIYNFSPVLFNIRHNKVSHPIGWKSGALTYMDNHYALVCIFYAVSFLLSSISIRQKEITHMWW